MRNINMYQGHLSLRLLGLCLLQFTLAQDAATPNANHIFNTVHSAMRQWGSSLNHNGMSLFLSTVPEDIRLYHGDSRNEPISGMQWLSFEPEHAALFAKKSGMKSWASSSGPDTVQNAYQADTGTFVVQEGTNSQGGSGRESSPTSSRWFHEYLTTRPLRLLYIDGMAAAKSQIGTLDLQDLIILGRQPDAPKISDSERLEQICARIEDVYNGKIDGVIRMEGGFEVILCKSEDVLQSTHIGPMKPTKGLSDGMNDNQDDGGFSYFAAVASRYHGIGGERVKMSFDGMVSGYAYAEQFPQDFEILPRILDLPEEARLAMRQDLDSMILEHDESKTGRNWQAVTDMIVSRYATALKLLHRTQDPELFRRRVQAFVEQFIDYQEFPMTIDIPRCASQYVPSSAAESTAGRAIMSVSTEICQTLANMFQQDEIEEARRSLWVLMEYLGWTTWRYCERCAEEQICWIPIFPLGTLDDRRTPQCLSESPPVFAGSYWWAKQT